MATISPTKPTNRHLTQEEIENNINGLAVTENRLREAFRAIDVNGNGYIDVDEMKQFYYQQENFGVEYTDEEITAKIMKYHSGNGKITFDEFSCIMLTIAQR